MTEKELNAMGVYIEGNGRGLWSVNFHGTWVFAPRRWFRSRSAALAYAIEQA